MPFKVWIRFCVFVLPVIFILIINNNIQLKPQIGRTWSLIKKWRKKEKISGSLPGIFGIDWKEFSALTHKWIKARDMCTDNILMGGRLNLKFSFWRRFSSAFSIDCSCRLRIFRGGINSEQTFSIRLLFYEHFLWGVILWGSLALMSKKLKSSSLNWRRYVRGSLHHVHIKLSVVSRIY